MAVEWEAVPFERLLVEPVRNGIYKTKEFHGRGAKIVNMGELFANPRLRSVPMKRVELSTYEFERFNLAEGDLIFARRSLTAEGAGKCSVVLEVDDPTTFESSIIRARPDPLRAESLYLYYFFNSPSGFHSLDTIRRQVAVAGITGSDLSRLEIPVPSLAEQRAIAHILGTLDDKIELNRRMNETLEAVARALFKSWFVDFDPVRVKADGRNPDLPKPIADLFPDSFEDSELGEIPRGWEIRPFSEMCESIFSGGTPSTSAPEYWGGEIPWLSSGETRSMFVIGTEKTITPDGVKHSSTRLARAGTTVIASAGQGHTRGQTSMLMLDTYINQSVVALVANPQHTSDDYLFFDLARRYEEFRQLSDGHSSRGSLTTKLLGGIQTVSPPGLLVAKFGAVVVPITRRIAKSMDESSILVALRDILLPKLVSGDLRVKDANRIVAAATS
jgi:type I restriction enzyme S subunit